MKLEWSQPALDDLRAIEQFIALDNPISAASVVSTILTLTENQLSVFPSAGRTGRVEGTYELVLPRLPFVVAYEMKQSHVTILAVLHESRQWPEGFQ